MNGKNSQTGQAREVMERQQKHDVRGKKQNVKKGVGKMAMHTFRDQAEKSDGYDFLFGLFTAEDTHVNTGTDAVRSVKEKGHDAYYDDYRN